LRQRRKRRIEEKRMLRAKAPFDWNGCSPICLNLRECRSSSPLENGVLNRKLLASVSQRKTRLARANSQNPRICRNPDATRCAAIIEQLRRGGRSLFVSERRLELVRKGREKLAKHGNKPLNLSKLAVFADALDKLDKVGRRSLGLDAQQGNYNVGLAVSVNVNSENDGGNGVQTGLDSTEKSQIVDV
jgi:hypothetical protein